MPKNVYRVELKLPRDLKNRIQRLMAEYTIETGNKISMSQFVSTAISDYLDSIQEEEKKSS